MAVAVILPPWAERWNFHGELRRSDLEAGRGEQMLLGPQERVFAERDQPVQVRWNKRPRHILAPQAALLARTGGPLKTKFLTLGRWLQRIRLRCRNLIKSGFVHWRKVSSVKETLLRRCQRAEAKNGLCRATSSSTIGLFNDQKPGSSPLMA